MHNQIISEPDEKNIYKVIIFVYVTSQQYVISQIFSSIICLSVKIDEGFVNHIHLYSLSCFKWAKWHYHTTHVKGFNQTYSSAYTVHTRCKCLIPI